MTDEVLYYIYCVAVSKKEINADRAKASKLILLTEAIGITQDKVEYPNDYLFMYVAPELQAAGLDILKKEYSSSKIAYNQAIEEGALIHLLKSQQKDKYKGIPEEMSVYIVSPAYDVN